MRNPVAKYMNRFNKPATHRNKKKDYKRRGRYGDDEINRPTHDPYEREHVNWTHLALDGDLDDED